MQNYLYILATNSLIFVAIAFIFMLFAKWYSDLLVISKGTYIPDYEIEEESNLAVALRRFGLYGAVAIGMTGTLSSPDTASLGDEILAVVQDGAVLTVLIMISRLINNYILLPGIKNDIELFKGNLAVAFVEAGQYIATGIIAYASFSGEYGPWYSSVVFFVLGQIVLLLMAFVYEKIADFEVKGNIYQAKASAGLMLGGMLIAQSLILKGAISGPFTGWESDLTSFGLSTLAGLFMLVIVLNKVVDRCFLPGTDIKTEIDRDDNVAAVTVVVGIKIFLAFIIGTVVI